MFLKFNEDAQKLLLLSLKEKNKLNDEYIGSEHVFLALLSMGGNYICEVLNSFNVTYDKFFSFFIKKTKKNYSNNCVFSPLLKNIFNNLATNVSNKNNEIMMIDIIIEILSDSSSKVIFILRQMEIDISSLLKTLNVNLKKKKTVKKSLLSELGVNLNEKNIDDVLIGRDEEINQIIEVLCCKNKNNPMLVGDAGVGKTAIVEELARRIQKGDVPFKLKGKQIYSVSMSSLVAGTKYRGEFEEKINKLILEVENNDDVILFIDEIHTLVGAGGADGAIDASNILKPSLARGGIKVIGATTKEEYNKYFSFDKALCRRFRLILCEEPDASKTKDILKGIKPIYEKFHGVYISDAIIDKIVYFSDKYIRNKKFPDKAIDILDEASVLASFGKNKDYTFITNLDKKKKNYLNLKNQSLLKGDYKTAMDYSHEEKKIQSLISKYQKRIYKYNSDVVVDDKIVLEVMERKTNIPFYSYSYKLKNINNLINKYKKEAIFENNIIDNVCDLTLDLYSSLTSKSISNKILISSCNESLNNYFISHYLNIFFKRNNIIHIDISNFRNIDDFLKNDDEDNLLNKISLYPFSILIISNYDCCDNSIKDFFDKVNKYGYYMDKKNKKLDFSNSLFIYSIVNKNSIGFNEKEVVDSMINIDGIDKDKLIKYIKNIALKENINISNVDVRKIVDIVMFNYDNFNNIDYLIKKECAIIDKMVKKKRTMKV